MLPERLRTFIAVELPDDVRENVWRAASELRDLFQNGIRWVRQENLHLTVKFLGMVYRDMIAEILDELRAAMRKCSQVSVAVNGVELFPPRKKPRVVCVGVHKDPRLEVIAKSVDGRLARLRIKKDHRRYLPHITIGRIKSRTVQGLERFDLSSLGEKMGTLPVTHLSFFMSELGPGGPSYTRLGRVEIGA